MRWKSQKLPRHPKGNLLNMSEITPKIYGSHEMVMGTKELKCTPSRCTMFQTYIKIGMKGNANSRKLRVPKIADKCALKLG